LTGWCEPPPQKIAYFARHFVGKMVILAAHLLVTISTAQFSLKSGSITIHANQLSLVVSTHLKNISQIGSFPQVGLNIKNL